MSQVGARSRVTCITCHVSHDTSLGGVLALVAGLHLVLELLHLQRHLVQLVPRQGHVLFVRSYKYFLKQKYFFVYKKILTLP